MQFGTYCPPLKIKDENLQSCQKNRASNRIQFRDEAGCGSERGDARSSPIHALGSGSFYNQAKIVRETSIPTVLWLLYDFLSLKKDVNVVLQSNKLKTLKKGRLMPGFRILIHLIRIRIQHFRLNTDPIAGFWLPTFFFFLNYNWHIPRPP